MNGKLALAEGFFKEAWEELKKYDTTKNNLFLQEACEKGWGATVQALKVVNPQIIRHRDFGETADKLARKYNNKELLYGEACGEILHREGFYEGVISKEKRESEKKGKKYFF